MLTVGAVADCCRDRLGVEFEFNISAETGAFVWGKGSHCKRVR